MKGTRTQQQRFLATILVVVLLIAALLMLTCIPLSPPAESLYAFDPTDDVTLVDNSTDVFLGRVVEQAGSKGVPDSGGGEVAFSQFEVEVLQTLKGDATGTVIVEQMGGVDPAEGLVLTDGDALLRAGQEILFATNRWPERDSYIIVVQPYGDIRVESEAQRAGLVARFAAAITEAASMPTAE